MSADFIIRIIGMAVFSIVGVYVGDGLSQYNPDQQLFYTITFTLFGALFGLVLTPYITTRPIRALRALLGRLAAETLFAGLIGLVIGLLTAALLAFPLSLLPSPFGKVLPFIGVLLFGYFGVAVFSTRQADIANILGGLSDAVLSADFGGRVLGGLFVGIVAPRYFDAYYEWQLGVAVSFVLAPRAPDQAGKGVGKAWLMRSRAVRCFALPHLWASTWCSGSPCYSPGEHHCARNFLGVVWSRILTPTTNRRRRSAFN